MLCRRFKSLSKSKRLNFRKGVLGSMKLKYFYFFFETFRLKDSTTPQIEKLNINNSIHSLVE